MRAGVTCALAAAVAKKADVSIAYVIDARMHAENQPGGRKLFRRRRDGTSARAVDSGRIKKVDGAIKDR